MPLFRSQKRILDTLTADEKRKKAKLDQDLLAAFDEAFNARMTVEETNWQLLQGRMRDEPEEFLWPYLAGSNFIMAGNFTEAELQAKRAKALRPMDPRSTYALASVYYAICTAARMREASRLIATKDAVNEQQIWPEGILDLGLTLEELFEAALAEFEASYMLVSHKDDRQIIQSSIEVIKSSLSIRRATA